MKVEDLFKPGKGLPPLESDLAPEQIIARWEQARDLIESDAWNLLDKYVSNSVEAIMEEIETAKEPMEVKRLQGQLSGVKVLRNLFVQFQQQAETAAEELKNPAQPEATEGE